jgi:FtsP/CotA-like multicopper oxidase with cupredoxin domain/plastocyanin
MRFSKSDKDAVGAGAAVFTIVAMALALVALLTAAQARNDSKHSVAAGGTSVALSEFALSPASVTVPVGGKLSVVNNGTTTHNLTIQGTKLKTKDLSPGDAASLDLSSLKAGMYTMYCAVPGHKDQGMVGDLMVGSGMNMASGAMVNTDRLRAENDTSDATMKAATDAYVAQLTKGPNTKGVGNVPLAPTVLPDGTKRFTLTASIIDWPVDPTTTVKAWAYNGTVPGPSIKVQAGDKVQIVLHNDLPQSTVIHFHGIETPNAMDGVPDVTQPPIKPGASFTYAFVAKGPALGIYHSHHHAEHQVPDGLFGVFQVGDVALPAGTGPLAQEVPMVLNDAGVIGLSLNGKSFPATAPVMTHVNDWTQIDYYNEGMQIHPMHLHGVPQLVIAKDGYPVPQPYMVDTLAIAPGERYSVLVHPTADQKGVWAFHCHILSHAESDKGMFGMVTTLIVQ